MKDLKRQRRDWEDLAAVDPYWAVLTHPDRKHGGWDRDSFVATGEKEVEALLTTAAKLGLPAKHERALDFGCGPGRLTPALAARFDHVVGVDISEPLVAEARRLNADLPNCEFRLSRRDDLSEFADGSLDLVCSNIVLQHQPSHRVIRSYIAEFLRVVGAGGLVVFQLPTRMPLRNRIQPRRRMYSLLRAQGLPPRLLYRRLRLDPMRMTCMSGRKVTAAVERSRGKVLLAEPDEYGGGFPSATYFVAPV